MHSDVLLIARIWWKACSNGRFNARSRADGSWVGIEHSYTRAKLRST